MNKVNFTYKTGRERMIHVRDADLLVRLGKGTYMTRDMTAQPPVQPVVVVSTQPQAPVASPAPLEKLGADALHAIAKERGIQVHHRAGAEKVREALREADE